MIKTFEDLGITDCITCNDQTCSGVATQSSSGEEYNLSISYDHDNSIYCVTGCCSSSNCGVNDTDEKFDSEIQTVEFLRKNFSNFKCF